LNRKELKRNSLKPYTQKQNGVAERENRTTVESVNAFFMVIYLSEILEDQGCPDCSLCVNDTCS
jgi:hypothetical protein